MFLRPHMMASTNVAALMGGAFDPLSLSPAALFDFSDFANLSTDSGGTTDATRGDYVRRADDLSGNGRHMSPSTDTRRPIAHGLPTTLGADLLTFASMTGGTGWSYAAGVWTKTAGTAAAISQAVTLTAGKLYAIFFDCTRTAGTLAARFTGGTTLTGYASNKSKSQTEFFVAVTGNTTFELYGDASFAGTVTRVSVHEVTGWTFNGLRFDGVDNVIATPAINLTGTQAMTVGLSYIADDRLGAAVIWNVGDYSASVANSVDRQMNQTPNVRGRDASLSGVGISFGGTEGPGLRPAMRTEIVEVDFSQASTAAQFGANVAGVAAAETTTGGPLTISGLPNGAFTIGASANGNGDARINVHRAALIPRVLTADERTNLDAWLTHGMPRCAALGDSTVAAGKITSGLLADTRPVSGFIFDAEFGVADVSKIGDKIADQKTLWTAIADKTKLEAVLIQIGLNDVKTYIGGNTKTSAQVIADLQDLVATVRAAAPAGCKIYVCGLTPCKVWLDAATNPAAAYAGWQAVNEAIAGSGSTPITGVDGRITSHVATLDDGSGNLAAAFNTAGDGVHPNNWGRWQVAQAWRAQLVADGLI